MARAQPQHQVEAQRPVAEAVVLGIGIDEGPDRPVLGGNLGLDTAPGAAVLRDDDRSLHGYAHPFQALVVGRDTIVDEDQRPGHIAVDAVD